MYQKIYLLFIIIHLQVVILFGREDELRPLNQQLVQEICNRTLLLCAECSNNNQLSDIADLLEGFFLLLSNFIKKVPQLIFSNEIDTSALFQCGKIFLYNHVGVLQKHFFFSYIMFSITRNPNHKGCGKFFGQFYYSEQRSVAGRCSADVWRKLSFKDTFKFRQVYCILPEICKLFFLKPLQSIHSWCHLERSGSCSYPFLPECRPSTSFRFLASFTKFFWSSFTMLANGCQEIGIK